MRSGSVHFGVFPSSRAPGEPCWFRPEAQWDQPLLGSACSFPQYSQPATCHPVRCRESGPGLGVVAWAFPGALLHWGAVGGCSSGLVSVQVLIQPEPGVCSRCIQWTDWEQVRLCLQNTGALCAAGFALLCLELCRVPDQGCLEPGGVADVPGCSSACSLSCPVPPAPCCMLGCMLRLVAASQDLPVPPAHSSVSPARF